MRGLSRTENRSDQPQARGAAPELRPAPRPPRHAFGHGKPSTAPDPRHTARLVKDHSNNNPLRSGRGLGAPSPQRERLTTPALPGASVPVLHAQCLLPTSTDWQDRNPPHSGAVAEQRTTKTLASPCVGASSAGGSLRVASASCELQPRLVPRRRQSERSGGHWP